MNSLDDDGCLESARLWGSGACAAVGKAHPLPFFCLFIGS